MSGGFLLSPAASSVASTSSTARPTLPRPRDSPLKSGGSKESTLIRYVDQRILHIQRRFAKRTTPSSAFLSDLDREKADSWGDVRGYGSMQEMCKDLDDLIDVVWISGTPGLQVPYLITIAMQLGGAIQAMPPTNKALFRTLNKLDSAFASLLQGRDVSTGQTLPGFLGRRGVSGTEKVRIRSLVERTRVNIVEVFKRGEFEFEDPEEEEEAGRSHSNDSAEKMEVDEDDELVIEDEDDVGVDEDAEDDPLDMQIARVYDRTVVELGDSLEAPNIGIITEERG